MNGHFELDWAGTGVQDLIVNLLNALSAVKSLSEINCEIVDEKLLIRQALAGLLQNQDMERCSFFILGDDDMLVNVTGMSIADPLEENANCPIKSIHFRVGEGVIGAAAETGRIQYCRNCREDVRFASGGDDSRIPGSVVSIPVYTLHHTLVGVLNVSHPVPEFFSELHLRLLDVYANILGQLITNRRLFQKMDGLIKQRTAELERVVDETRQLKDYYAQMSMHDHLTGLHNRHYFYDQAELALAKHRRYESPFCVLVIDIDHFKSINDQYGHAFGDLVLKGVGQSLKREVRKTDILVRFGGEEFVVIFGNTCCDSGASFAERIRKQIKTLSWSQTGQTVTVTVSIGLFCLSPGKLESERELEIDQIIHYADIALYAAKNNGRDRVEVFRD